MNRFAPSAWALLVTAGGVNNGADSRSLDGQKVVFIRNRDGVYKTYWMNADGTGVTEIPSAEDGHLFSWGSSLSFWRTTPRSLSRSRQST